MCDELREWRKRLEEGRHIPDDCLIIYMGSHGNTNGIRGAKGIPNYFDTDVLTDVFSTKNCPRLKDKPKIFITNACSKLPNKKERIVMSEEFQGNCSMIFQKVRAKSKSKHMN